MKIERHKVGGMDITILIAENGKKILNKLSGRVVGVCAVLDKMYYDNDGRRLPEPYMMKVSDFVEVDNNKMFLE